MVSGVLLDKVDEVPSWGVTFQKWGRTIYNSEDGTFIGRTCMQWFQLLVFYICFYVGLAVFFGVGLFLFLHQLSSLTPKYVVEDSLLGDTPGMGFAPKITDDGTDLLWVNGTCTEKNCSCTGKNDCCCYSGEEEYIKTLTDFMKPYKNAQQTADTFVACRNDRESSEEEVCKVPISDLGPCGIDPTFGYSTKSPCVALKLNKMISWLPHPYTDVDQVPANVTDFYNNVLKTKFELDPSMIYITCTGQNDADNEHMGPIMLHPKTIPKYYFPYRNTPGYLSPLVMVQFLNPQTGIVINVRCSAWAKNLKPDTSSSTFKATTSFRLLVSTEKSQYF
ncbi:putative Sodium/potassium-transporting ATPase subunit beta-2 [Hypsibius exemplaris]|uniref:Sodium/potassium-transporting ATPase subunit beta-2 n=1 Tax=Hypsibius exemplaris TaxID=2072580 RepID=A0A1W0WUA8_HYPEX|nr:putative Sodium/potassium-transporting ATPase subunit beta-2 [Hypsibius exemplaris]